MNPLISYLYLFSLIATSLHAAYGFPAMPFNMAVHFGPEGRADLWWPREAYFGTVLAAIALNAAVFGLGPWIASLLDYRGFRFPGRERCMSSERIGEFYSYFRPKMVWFGIANFCLLGFVNQLVFNANSISDRFNGEALLVGLAAYFLFVIIWLLTLFRRLSRGL